VLLSNRVKWGILVHLIESVTSSLSSGKRVHCSTYVTQTALHVSLTDWSAVAVLD
jgi:hypothetical protein